VRPQIIEKLEILADAAKYDVSCASSGSHRQNSGNGMGDSSGVGICHSYTEDGRCVSLLKILFTNHCIYDCAYCVSRRSNDVKRAAFTVGEVVELTLGFYRRNYIEGLFLSSGIFKDADTTTEKLVRVARELRETHNFHGYIHLKVIPGASKELLEEAGRHADRLSVNLEIPTEPSLKKVAPEKDFASVHAPMGFLNARIAESKQERKVTRNAPKFSPGGQSTQIVVGATPEDDRTVLNVAGDLYRDKGLRRVYYSGYVPISSDARVPQIDRAPIVREHRLYQADWLLRFYGFSVDEIVDDDHSNLPLDIDPKTAYAIRNPHLYPIDVNRASLEMLLRVPGVGHKSAKRIIAGRRYGRIRWEHLKRFGVVLKRAKYFIEVPGHRSSLLENNPQFVRAAVAEKPAEAAAQLSLFDRVT
jgi:putative DNA modification/repair radical SAM protein